MAENINYGPSAASKAQAGADAYAIESAQSLADINRSISEEAARLESAIVTGMSPAEIAARNASIAALKERAANVIAASQGAYTFAQEQAKTSADIYGKSMEQLQASQRQLAAQALGTAGAGVGPGEYNRFTAEGTRALRENAAATMATVGGEGSVPVNALVPTTGLVETAGGGLTGIGQGASLLFGRALGAAQARSLAEIQGQQLALGSQIERDAMQAASDRERAERQRVTDFRTSMFQYATQLAGQIGTNLATLRSTAASADTRTGKQLADAELKLYERKAAIDWKNTMREIAARAKAAGVSAEQSAAEQKAYAYTLGSANDLGKLANMKLGTLAYLPTDRTRENLLIGKGGKPITTTGKDRWYMNAGILSWDEDGNGDAKAIDVPIQSKMEDVLAFLGNISLMKPAERNKAWNSYWNDPKNGLGGKEWRGALEILFGADAKNPQWYLNVIDGKVQGSTFTPQQAADKKKADEAERKRLQALGTPPPVTLPQIQQAVLQPGPGFLGLGVRSIGSKIPVVGNILGLR